MKIQYNIMIADIGKKNNLLKYSYIDTFAIKIISNILGCIDFAEVEII